MLLSNRSGAIYSFTLPPGALTPDPGGRIFRFNNLDALTSGGTFSVKIKRTTHGAYTFGFVSFADLSAATDPYMRLQFYIGDDANVARDGRGFITIDVPWTRTPQGWRAPKDH